MRSGSDRLPLTALLAGAAAPARLALVGAGGKTTLMYALARELAGTGPPVLCTTTTHIRPPLQEQSDVLALTRNAPDWKTAVEALAGLLRPGAVICVAEGALPGQDKLKGLPHEAVDDLSRRFPDIPLLIEADGAAMRPLKAPAPHEPAMAGCATTVVAVAGLDAVGCPLDGVVAHRPGLVAALTGLKPGEVICAAALARLAVHSRGMLRGAPESALRRVFFNKAELPGALAVAFQMTTEARPDALSRWFAGSARDGWCLCLTNSNV